MTGLRQGGVSSDEGWAPAGFDAPALQHEGVLYRPEVDGLRALAVLPVLAFHGGSRWFGGGYVGVDIFFVISGYLITSIIMADHAGGGFSIVRFYERRARRILPALFLVIATFVPLAWAWMTPHHLKEFAQSIVATVLFAPNIYYFLKSGYFELGTEERPLLHTWSLGVEEQYYIIFPWLVTLCLLRDRRVLQVVLVATALVSLLCSEWASHRHAASNFYLLPCRAWELALGSMLVLGVPARWGAGRVVQPQLRGALALVGVALMVIPMFAYDKETRFPGFSALAPTLGASLVITFGRPDTWVGRALSVRPVVGIGLISYSLYLWHQPLFAFARIQSTGALSGWSFVLLGLAAIALAYLTWRFVERPFRDRRRWSRNQVFAFATIGMALLCAIGVAGHQSEGMPGRLSPEVREILAFGDRLQSRHEGFPPTECFLAPGESASRLGACMSPASGTQEAEVLWGDSHAAHLYAGLQARFAGGVGLIAWTMAACPPLMGAGAGGSACSAFNDAVLTRIAALRPRRVVLAAVWSQYDWSAVSKTVKALRVAGVADIEVVGPVPRWYPSLPVVLSRFGVAMSKLPSRTTLGLDPTIESLDRKLAKLSAELGATYRSAYAALCSAEGCLVRVGDEPAAMMQWDVSHLTLLGSRELANRMWPR